MQGPIALVGTATVAALTLLASGCASSGPPTLGDDISNAGAQYENVAAEWKDGEDKVKKGRRLVKKGRQQMRDGEDNVGTGEDLIREGELMKTESKRAYERLKGRSGGFPSS